MEPNEQLQDDEQFHIVTDETDWGNNFDDMEADDWENHMDGPEDDYFQE